MEDKKEKLPNARIQCEKLIYRNMYSSHCKCSLFYNEIFTFLVNCLINEEYLWKKIYWNPN